MVSDVSQAAVKHLQAVLILVLMEYGLGHDGVTYEPAKVSTVLILVLMEYGLGQ